MTTFVDYVNALRRGENPRVEPAAPRRTLISDVTSSRAGQIAGRYGEARLGLQPGSLTPATRMTPPPVPGSGSSEPPTGEPAFPGGPTTGGTVTVPFNPLVPGTLGTGGGGMTFDPLGLGGDCPGLFNVKINGQCVDLSNAAPGGDPMITGQVDTSVSAPGMDGYGEAVKGRYGVGLIPRVEVRPTRLCPRGMVLGNDGVCYDRSRLRKSDREWDPGTKPLLTGGERAAIAKARRAAGKLETAKKSLKKVGKAFAKVC